MENEIKSKVPLDEIAQKLKVPRHFLGKVMKRLVKEGIIDSKRGPAGGFCLNERTLETRLITLIRITETEQYDSCVLRLRKCNSHNPCPLHEQAEVLKTQWHDLLAKTTINELLKKESTDFIRSIAAF